MAWRPSSTSGDISATGTGSAGIYAAGYAGSVVMNLGNVVGGPCCAGVMQYSANATTLLNWGTITAGLADFAIESYSASNTVENFGTVTGDVSLDRRAQRVHQPRRRAVQLRRIGASWPRHQ